MQLKIISSIFLFITFCFIGGIWWQLSHYSPSATFQSPFVLEVLLLMFYFFSLQTALNISQEKEDEKENRAKLARFISVTSFLTIMAGALFGSFYHEQNSNIMGQIKTLFFAMLAPQIFLIALLVLFLFITKYATFFMGLVYIVAAMGISWFLGFHIPFFFVGPLWIYFLFKEYLLIKSNTK